MLSYPKASSLSLVLLTPNKQIKFAYKSVNCEVQLTSAHVLFCVIVPTTTWHLHNIKIVKPVLIESLIDIGTKSQNVVISLNFACNLVLCVSTYSIIELLFFESANK